MAKWLILIIGLAPKFVFGGSVAVADDRPLPETINSIPLNYPGAVGLCSSLNSIDINERSSKIKSGCRLKFYRKPDFEDNIDAAEKIIDSELDKVYEVNSNAQSKIRSIGVRNCYSPLWVVACSDSALNGTCAFSESSGHFPNLNNVGLRGGLKSFMVCASKQSCSSSVNLSRLKNDKNPKVILPCHSDLVNYSKEELRLSINAILDKISSRSNLYLEQHNTKMVELSRYWGAIQKLKKIEKMKALIPSKASILNPVKNELTSVERFSKDFNILAADLTAAVEFTKETKELAVSQRKEFIQSISSTYSEIEAIPSISYKEKFRRIQDAKWQIAQKSEDVRLKLNDALKKNSNSMLRMSTIQRDIKTLRREHPEAGPFMVKLDEVYEKAGAILVALQNLNNSISKIVDQLAEEVINHHKKLDRSFQTAIEEAADAEFAERMKLTRRLSATEKFMGLVGAKLGLLSQDPPSSKFYHRPYLADHYEKYLDLIVFGKICEGNLEQWMKSGCKNFGLRRPLIDRRIAGILDTLNSTIAFFIGLGVEPDEAKKIEVLVKDGRTREALSRHDLILKRWEELN